MCSPSGRTEKNSNDFWIYLIDKTGTIATRYEGPVVALRMKKDLMPLLG